jgi:pimeloyl-ACP methyl ester carboxylesterase
MYNEQHWLEDTIIANGIHQHYYRTGGDKPVLVLLHGFTENGLVWSRVARTLEGEYDMIMVDARGHGHSDGPEHGYSQEILNQDVAELIRVLKLAQPVLMGHSNGALTAAQVAAQYPELVRAIVLEDPPWVDVAKRPPMMTQNSSDEPWPGYTAWRDSWMAWHRALRTQTPAERLASSQQFLPPGAQNWPEETLLAHLEAQAQFNLAVLDHVPPIPGGSSWRETVERIECPVLLLTGNPARGAGITPELAEKIVATLKMGQLAYFEGAGHFTHYQLQGEQFDRFIHVIKAFLSSL